MILLKTDSLPSNISKIVFKRREGYTTYFYAYVTFKYGWFSWTKRYQFQSVVKSLDDSETLLKQLTEDCFGHTYVPATRDTNPELFI